MKQENKKIKLSKLAAKTAVRIFVIILFFGLFPFVTGNNTHLDSTHLYIENKWTLVFPAILFIGFTTLLVLCMKKKYQEPDLNWLLVLNTVILLTYLIMLYSRIFKAGML